MKNKSDHLCSQSSSIYDDSCFLDMSQEAKEWRKRATTKLGDIPTGNTFTIGKHEFVVLEQVGETTAVILKDLLPNKSCFDILCNNYAKSVVSTCCQSFAYEIAIIIGIENIIKHDVDLTADDGLKDYGTVQRFASLLTANLYRRYVDILDNFNPDTRWWLATASSTPRHDREQLVKCVSPSGTLFDCSYSGHFGPFGVRPYMVLKSEVSVSADD